MLALAAAGRRRAARRPGSPAPARAGTPARHVAALGTGYFAQIRTLAGAGPDSFASSERAAEAAAINRTLGYTPYVRVAGTQHRSWP